jgi:hypothetical protein
MFEKISLGVLLIVIFNVIIFITMHLWNWLMPFLFSLPEITFWQTWGIMALSFILFKTPNIDKFKKL